MFDFIARRLVSIIPVLAVVALFVFFMLRLTPGDPAAVIAGDNATSDQIAHRLEPTLALSICTLILAVSTAVPLGVIAAYRQGSILDRVVMGFSVLGFSMPSFVIGYCLIYVFAIELGWLPVQGYTRIGTDFWAFLERMVLPSVTLGIIYVALIARITRASILEVLNEDYIRTARAKGLSNRVVLMRHA